MYFEIHYERGLARLSAGKLEQALQDFAAVMQSAGTVEDFYRRNPFFDTPKGRILATLKNLIARATQQRELVLKMINEREKKRSR